MVNTQGFNPKTGEWNDSLTGNFLWSNTNIGETMSDVTTPFTWSMVGATFQQMNIMPEYPVVGNIGGRAYYNVSVMSAAMRAMGRKMDDLNTEMGGVREEYLPNLPEIIIPVKKPAFFPLLLRLLEIRRMQNQGSRQIPKFLAENLDWCSAIHRTLPHIIDKTELAVLMREVLIPYTLSTFWLVMGSAWEHGEQTGKLRRYLSKRVGDEDIDILLSNVSNNDDLLASLGPLVGLTQLKRGEISRKEYIDQWGHRGPHETELSIMRPAEDPAWLDQQMAMLEQSPIDVDTLLAQRRTAFETAWARYQTQDPRKAKSTRRRLAQVAEANRVREAVRSELVRIIWVGRAWALKAGQLTGLGDDIFFLTIEEAADLLEGKDALTVLVPARRTMHNRYKSLPPYPILIRGQFDPFQWAANPSKRTDFHDPEGLLIRLTEQAEKQDPGRANKILGAPGSGGVVEGLVRRIDNPEEGSQLQPGEILVTVQTNVGWTPLFPLAKAIVTDVGAALSHAAIVARELGIPAVVNCTNATSRLKTGDRVRVDGSAGSVEILQSNDHC